MRKWHIYAPGEMPRFNISTVELLSLLTSYGARPGEIDQIMQMVQQGQKWEPVDKAFEVTLVTLRGDT